MDLNSFMENTSRHQEKSISKVSVKRKKTCARLAAQMKTKNSHGAESTVPTENYEPNLQALTITGHAHSLSSHVRGASNWAKNTYF